MSCRSQTAHSNKRPCPDLHYKASTVLGLSQDEYRQVLGQLRAASSHGALAPDSLYPLLPVPPPPKPPTPPPMPPPLNNRQPLQAPSARTLDYVRNPLTEMPAPSKRRSSLWGLATYKAPASKHLIPDPSSSSLNHNLLF